MIPRLAVLALAAALTVTVATPTRAQPAAPTSMLRLDDLPAGWTMTEMSASADAGRVGDECGNGPAVVPISAGMAQFQAGPDGPYILHSVAVFAPGDVDRAWAYLADDWSDCGGRRPADLPFMPLPIPGLGDAAITREATGLFGMADAQLQVVIWRRGDAIALINVTGVAAHGGIDTALTVRLARLVDERLRQLGTGKGK